MAKGDTLILGTRKGVLIFERSKSADWRLARDAHLGAVAPFADLDRRTGALWATLSHGHWGTKLHRSRDLGRTWEEIPAPKYPEGAEIKPGAPAALKYPWVVAFGGRDQPGRLYLGTVPGGLFVSDDQGASWSLNGPLWDHPSRSGAWFGGGFDDPGVHSVCVHPRDSRRWFVGVSVAGVFETTDDGRSWTARNKGLLAEYLPDPHVEVGHDPHLLAMAPSDPDVMWQQNHCGIFRTGDAALSWSNVSQPKGGGPARFGFAVAIDERDPGTAWVVPAISDEVRTAVDGSMCVCRTTDAGRTWTALRRGLPQEACYDVTFRHALDALGDRLAFGTTTGNLFVSEDRGDSWRCLGHHLPPIYSVRFVEA